MRVIYSALAIAMVTLAACSRGQEASKTKAADTSGAAGRQMAMPGMSLVPQMRAHLDSMGSMPADQVAAAMVTHQDLASRLLDAMGADMRGMNMQPDSAWASLSDSVRQDLAELPGLSGPALTTSLQGHIGRMRRMMAMHEGMMRM